MINPHLTKKVITRFMSVESRNGFNVAHALATLKKADPEIHPLIDQLELTKLNRE